VKEKREDDKNNVSDLAFAQDSTGGRTLYVFTGTCHKCGKTGHRFFECPDRFNESKSEEKKKEEEKVATTTDVQKKTITGQQHSRDADVLYDDDEKPYNDHFELLFCQGGRVSKVTKINAGVFDYNKACNQVLSQMDSIEINPWWVLLGNCSTVNIFSNKNLLRNIRQSNMYVEVKCNAGSRTTYWIGDFPGLPERVWSDGDGRCNILSIKRVKKLYHIAYDSDNEQGFSVTHRTKGTSRSFFESKKGLHYSDFKRNPVSTHVFTTMVKKQKENSSRQDVQRAEVAR
jgi:hypothetical protein